MAKNMLSEITTDIKAAAEIIADNMIKTRKRSEIVYNKRLNIKGVTDTAHLGARCVDLLSIYPEAKKGDNVFVATILKTEKAVKTVGEIMENINGMLR